MPSTPSANADLSCPPRADILDRAQRLRHRRRRARRGLRRVVRRDATRRQRKHLRRSARTNIQEGATLHTDIGFPARCRRRLHDRPQRDPARLHDRRRRARSAWARSFSTARKSAGAVWSGPARWSPKASSLADGALIVGAPAQGAAHARRGGGRRPHSRVGRPLRRQRPALSPPAWADRIKEGPALSGRGRPQDEAELGGRVRLRNFGCE